MVISSVSVVPSAIVSSEAASSEAETISSDTILFSVVVTSVVSLSDSLTLFASTVLLSSETSELSVVSEISSTVLVPTVMLS